MKAFCFFTFFCIMYLRNDLGGVPDEDDDVESQYLSRR